MVDRVDICQASLFHFQEISLVMMWLVAIARLEMIGESGVYSSARVTLTQEL